MVSRTMWPLLWLLMVALSTSGCEGFFETPHAAVEEGNAALANDDLEGALSAYEEAASELPESAELDYARGSALSLSNQHDEATQRLLRALQTKDPELRTRVQAALGAAYARWALELERQATSAGAAAKAAEEVDAPALDGPDPKALALPKWERAVDHLEKALRAKADEDVLRNLEIALLRVDPPCAARNDESEPNDRPEQATPIELAAAEDPSAQPGQAQAPQGAQDVLSWTRQFYACPDDADWFQVELQAGDRLKVSLKGEAEEGQLAMALHAPGGVTQLIPAADSVEWPRELSFSVPAGRWRLPHPRVER